MNSHRPTAVFFLLLCALALALATACEGLDKDIDGLEFVGPPAPEGLVATQGEYVDYVLVQWDDVQGAEEYQLYRDDELIYEGFSTEFEDHGAEAPTTNGPSNVSASSDIVDYVELTWDGPQTDDGKEHRYRVVSIAEDADGRSTDDVTGYRGAPEVEGVEIWTDGGQELRATIGADETSYQDEEAANYNIALATDELAASQGDYDGEIRLYLPEWFQPEQDGSNGEQEEVDKPAEAIPLEAPEEESYVLRPVLSDTVQGDYFGDTEPALGIRGEPVLETSDIDWTRFEDPEAESVDDDWSADVEDDYWRDSDSPEDNSPRYYRAVIDAAGVERWESDIALGYAACDPDAEADFGGGLGTAELPHQLCSPDHLHTLSSRVAAGETDDGEFFALADNITFSSNGEPFTPIGVDEERPFDLSFDGNHHSIENLVVDADNSAPAGLFGHVNAASVENLQLRNARVQGTTRVGTLMGSASGAYISGVVVDGRVQGNRHVGGLVGELVSSTIYRAHSSAHIRAVGSDISDAGGLVGTIDDSDLDEVSARGHLFANGNHVGALVGYVESATIRDVYTSGSIYANSAQAVGGLIGAISEGGDDIHVERGYVRGGIHAASQSGWIIGADPSQHSESFERLYFNSESRCHNCSNAGASDGLENDQLHDKSSFESGDNPWDFGLFGDDDAVWTMAGHGPPRHQWKTSSNWELISHCDGDATPFAGGNGSSSNPYVICSREQLETLAGADVDENHLSRHFILGGDIHLGDEEWTALGVTDGESIDFTGTFDGRGHRISRMTAVEALPGDTEDFGRGLFHRIGVDGELRNLELTDVQLSPNDDAAVGGITGINAGTIEAVAVTIELDNAVLGRDDPSENPIGGIAGESTGTISTGAVYGIMGVQFSEEQATAALGGAVGLMEGNATTEGIYSEVYFNDETIVVGPLSEATTSGFRGEWGGVGGIVGRTEEYGSSAATIADSRYVGIMALENFSHVGGVVGHISSRDFISSISPAQITGCMTGGRKPKPLASRTHIEGQQTVGGLVGHLDDAAVIDKSAVDAELKGDQLIGGLIGVIETRPELSEDPAVAIENSYSDGQISLPHNGVASTAGLIGFLECDGYDAEGDNLCSGTIDTVYSAMSFDYSATSFDPHLDGDPLVAEADEIDLAFRIAWRDRSNNHWINDDVDPDLEDGHLWGSKIAEADQSNIDCFGDAQDCGGSTAWNFDDVWTMPEQGPPRLQREDEGRMQWWVVQAPEL